METISGYSYNYIDDHIGVGGYGDVYKARKTGQPDVAIKCIRKDGDLTLIEREIKTLQVLTEINHENIVRLYEVIPGDKNIYFVMEFCNGRDLGLKLRRERTMTEAAVWVLLKHISSAFKVLQDRKIIHRDVKPGNILLSLTPENPENITYKLADFGLARFLPPSISTMTFSRGTFHYRAPETFRALNPPQAQAEGEGIQYDAKIDVWGLGVVAFECISGKRPYGDAYKENELIDIYKNPQAKLAYPFPQGTSEKLQNLLKKLLRIKPEERMSIEELLSQTC